MREKWWISMDQNFKATKDSMELGRMSIVSRKESTTKNHSLPFWQSTVSSLNTWCSCEIKNLQSTKNNWTKLSFSTCCRSRNCWMDSGFSSRPKPSAFSKKYLHTMSGSRRIKKKRNLYLQFACPSSSWLERILWLWWRACLGTTTSLSKSRFSKITTKMTMRMRESRKKTCLQMSDRFIICSDCHDEWCRAIKLQQVLLSSWKAASSFCSWKLLHNTLHIFCFICLQKP